MKKLILVSSLSLLALNSFAAPELTSQATSPVKTYTCGDLYVRKAVAADLKQTQLIKYSTMVAAVATAAMCPGGLIGLSAAYGTVGAVTGVSLFLGGGLYTHWGIDVADAKENFQSPADKSYSLYAEAISNSKTEAEKQKIVNEAAMNYGRDLVKNGKSRFARILEDAKECGKERDRVISDEQVLNLIIDGFNTGRFCEFGESKTNLASWKQIKKYVINKLGCK